jgi:hypothetical protein
MRTSKRSAWKHLLAACVIALLVLPAAASAMEYADVPAIAVRQENAAVPAPTTVREVRTVRIDGTRTLPIALSAAALGIALAGTGYVMFRLSPRTARPGRPTVGA